jgi:hypothetical protein
MVGHVGLLSFRVNSPLAKTLSRTFGSLSTLNSADAGVCVVFFDLAMTLDTFIGSGTAIKSPRIVQLLRKLTTTDSLCVNRATSLGFATAVESLSTSLRVNLFNSLRDAKS